MSEPLLREAKPEDVDPIYALLDAAFSPYKDQYPIDAYNSTVASKEVLTQRIPSEEEWIYVVTIDEAIVGTVSLHIKDGDNLYFYTMAVDPKFQGRGIGKILFNKLDQMAQLHGCSVISLETSDPLQTTHVIYEKMGYKRTGKTRPYHGIEVFEMEKRL